MDMYMVATFQVCASFCLIEIQIEIAIYCFEFLMDCFHQWTGIDTTNMVVESMKKKKKLQEENGLFSSCHRRTFKEDQINWRKLQPGF
jgi:hypothetical protein